MAHPIGTMEEILRAVAAGNPVIVLQDLGLAPAPTWHFAVVIGFDRAARTLVLRSGHDKRKLYGWPEFEGSWGPGGRWAQTILAPDQIPAGADEKRFIRAAVGLEQARRHRAASIAYRTAIGRWPDSRAARIGLGNSLYALGRLEAAAETFRAAAARHPSDATAFNNLAHVLAELNRTEDATLAAAEALALSAGKNDARVKTTLKEVLSRDRYVERRILVGN